MAVPIQYIPSLYPLEKHLWEFETKKLGMNLPVGSNYKLIPGEAADFEKVRAFFLRNPPTGYDIGSVEILYNPTLISNFEGCVNALNLKTRSTVYQQKWYKEAENTELKTKIYNTYLTIISKYMDSAYPNLQFLPMWHSINETAIDSLCEAGFANLITSDLFGKGIYSSYEADYAWRINPQNNDSRTLILSWNTCFLTYPVIDSDIKELEQKADPSLYDARFIPLVPSEISNSQEESYIPLKTMQKAVYQQLVVLQAAQCLPSYIVRLQANIKMPISTISKASSDQFIKLERSYQRAKNLFLEGNVKNAFLIFTALANVSFQKAYFYKGFLYYHGYGIPQDYVKAIKYFNLACKLDNGNAFYYLGECLFYGKGCDQDTQKAYLYFSKAKALKNTHAATALATLFN